MGTFLEATDMLTIAAMMGIVESDNTYIFADEFVTGGFIGAGPGDSHHTQDVHDRRLACVLKHIKYMNNL